MLNEEGQVSRVEYQGRFFWGYSCVEGYLRLASLTYYTAVSPFPDEP